jgi:hypothetical protein
LWDSSAVVPLLVGEETTDAMRAIAVEDPAMLVWWATEVECASAIARLERDEDLSGDGTTAAFARLDALAESWNEVLPGYNARRTARRLLEPLDAYSGSTAFAQSAPCSLPPRSWPQRGSPRRWRS